MARIIYSLDEYAVIVEHIGEEVTRGQIEEMRRTRKRVDTMLGHVESGPYGHLSRLGRATGFGSRAGGHLRHRFQSSDLLSVIVKAVGPWQIVDDVDSRRTKPHDIGPRNDANPRPLKPAKKFAPSLRMVSSGDFAKGVVEHQGSARHPLWHNAFQAVQPQIRIAHGRAWQESIRKAVG